MNKSTKLSKMFVITSVRFIGIITTIFFFSTFLTPNYSYAASIENLDEMIARKARYATNPWPTSLLEDSNNYYIWQPETLCYTDIQTGHEVWVMTHAPEKQELNGGWSYDGSRIGFFSSYFPTPTRPTKNTALGAYHYRWIVNTDGSKLRALEGYGRDDFPSDGFSWSPVDLSYYSFGSRPQEALGSSNAKLFRMVLDGNNVARGTLVLDTSSVNPYKKEIIPGGISPDGSRVVFRDFTSQSLPTPNPILTTQLYFADLKPTPKLTYHWGVARHIGPSRNNWADPYGNHTSAAENHFHGVEALGPDGTRVVGSYSGSAIFVLFKDHGSASDGGPLWQDWNGTSFGNDEIKVISTGAGTPSNPYGNVYLGHPAIDKWGRYALFANYADWPRPGLMIFDYSTNHMLSNYPFHYNGWLSNHQSWSGWTDWPVAVRSDSFVIETNKWNATTKPGDPNFQTPILVVNTHYVGPNTNYNAYPRPSQSPDGTKVAFAQYFLNSSQSYPYIAYAVVYYPYPPVTVRAQKNSTYIRLTWTRPSYTTRGWPNETTNAPPKAREIKGFHVWVSDNGETEWTELTTTEVTTEYYDVAQANGTTRYYALTSEEHSRLESRKLSEVRKVTLNSSGTLMDSQYAPEGKAGFWMTKPPVPSNFTVTKQSTPGQYLLKWIEPNNSKIRYYNIYYSTKGPPPVDQRYRIASVPVGTSKYLDWLADQSQPTYYKITSVDRQGNEGTKATN